FTFFAVWNDHRFGECIDCLEGSCCRHVGMKKGGGRLSLLLPRVVFPRGVLSGKKLQQCGAIKLFLAQGVAHFFLSLKEIVLVILLHGAPAKNVVVIARRVALVAIQNKLGLFAPLCYVGQHVQIFVFWIDDIYVAGSRATMTVAASGRLGDGVQASEKANYHPK